MREIIDLGKERVRRRIGSIVTDDELLLGLTCLKRSNGDPETLKLLELLRPFGLEADTDIEFRRVSNPIKVEEERKGRTFIMNVKKDSLREIPRVVRLLPRLYSEIILHNTAYDNNGMLDPRCAGIYGKRKC